MPFRYRFQQVLKIKSDVREQAERTLAEATRKEREAMDEYQRLLKLDEQTRLELNQMMNEHAVNPTELMNIQRYLDGLKVHLFQQNNRCNTAKKQTEACKLELRKAMQQEEMWDKHRQKQKEHYLFEQDRIEQAMLDELAQSMRERQRLAEEQLANDANGAR